MEQLITVIVNKPTIKIGIIMPKEETIELRHIRGVIGEKEDLPSLNSRTSLASRIRSLTTKSFGVPQLTHIQGSLGLNKTLTFNVGEDLVQSMFSDGTYLYCGLFSVGKIIKVDLSTFTEVSSLALNVTGIVGVNQITSDGTYLYCALTGTPGRIAKVSLSTFTESSILTLDAGENHVMSLFSDGSYLYCGMQTTPGMIVKVSLSTFTKTTTLTLAAGENYVMSLFSDGSYLYAAVNATSGKIVKINLGTFASTTTLNYPSGTDYTEELFSDGLYLYAASTDAIMSYLSKIDLRTFTFIQKFYSPTFDYFSSLFCDGTYLYIGTPANPGVVHKVDLLTFDIILSITLEAGEDSAGALFSDGTYLYLGCSSQPGKVVRKYIIPSVDMHQRKIDITKECIQSIVSATTSDGNANGTTLIDTARIEGDDYWNNMTLLILGGAYKGQSRRISDFDFATTTLTVSPAFSGKIVLGVRYAILPDVATGATSTLTQADILSDATPFAGADIAIVKADTQTIEDSTLKAAPTAGSLSTFIASGGVALGTALPNSKSLYDVIALDRLDNATYGLSAIETLIDDLETRLTAARAGYLDNLSAGAVAQASVATDIRLAELDAANLPADVDTIKGYTDNLVASVTNGTYSHSNDTNENVVLTFTAAIQDINLYLDMVNITQTSTIREYIEVDASTYRQLSAKVFPTDFDTSTKSISISFKQPNKDYKITLQSSVVEGSAKNIPYSYRTESRS